MRLKAAVKGGLISGAVLGVALHYLGYALLYEAIYAFEWPRLIQVVLSFVFGLAGLMAFTSIGPLALYFAREESLSTRDAIFVGAGSGLVAGTVVYLFFTSTTNTLVLGVIPFIVPLVETAMLEEAALREVLLPIVRSTIWGTYLIIVVQLLIFTLLGGGEAWIVQLGRRLRSRLKDAA